MQLSSDILPRETIQAFMQSVFFVKLSSILSHEANEVIKNFKSFILSFFWNFEDIPGI